MQYPSTPQDRGLTSAYPSEIVKRDGRVVPFDPGKIESAIRRCLLAEHVDGVERLAREVTQAALHVIVAKHEALTVEQVQDAVEVALLSVGMRGEARAYMAYRDERARMRADGAASTPRPVRQKPSGWGDFAHTIFSSRYSMGGAEAWEDTARRVAWSVFRGLPATVHARTAALSSAVERLIVARQFMPGGRYLYAAGRELHQVNNCLLCFVDDSREGWADHVHKHVMGLSTGAGMGTVYSRLRPKGARLRRTGGVASGPIPLMVATNELGRGLRQGGDRRSALWAGLHWWHRDAVDFVRVKDWTPEVRAMKAANWEFPAPMDGTNISVILDDEFFAAMADPEYRRTDPIHGEVTHQRAHDVFWAAVRGALREGDPGFSVDIGANAGESGRNACTELTTRDDSDICNIGSLNLARFRTLDEFRAALRPAVAFLLAGTVYSDVPYAKVAEVRAKNRRLGLGLMGVHEWLLQRGRSYGPDAELEEWLAEYACSTEIAHEFADEWGISRPVKTRAMAPNGTIGIVAETTTCMEPLLTVAYKRLVKEGDRTWAQYVVDPVAERLIQSGIQPEAIETAYSLSETMAGVERRIAFQAWFQRYVDHGIASTINLAPWGTPTNCEATVEQFGKTLLRYLPYLRGITVYPDGARGGQPITQVPYHAAAASRGERVYETGDVCDLRGGSCGS